MADSDKPFVMDWMMIEYVRKGKKDSIGRVGKAEDVICLGCIRLTGRYGVSSGGAGSVGGIAIVLKLFCLV